MGKNEFITYYKSPYFSILVRQNKFSTFLKLIMHTRIVTTAHIPFITTFLKQYNPTVLVTECFNPQNLPFYKEVKSTELGHLFEHMLIDEMRRLQENNGFKHVYNGETSWDWEKSGYGVFSIWIDSGYSEEPLMHTALNETIMLFRKLLTTKADAMGKWKIQQPQISTDF